ncbi:MAG: bifunctional diaminohydroxyphosphoribosylaminopyrimidine deaminase/5-amino-6-(5-phosphoribosylamino)uracil reductase RibD [Planctomycetota bacterium]
MTRPINPTKHFLDLAARQAIRGFGLVEPNPLVGCVLTQGSGPDERVIGLGHHTRFGDPHAEREALASARRQNNNPRGSTAYVTLEPCCHHGKQPPCTDALIEAGVARVVYASRDPNPEAAGGAEVLQRAGVETYATDASPLASGLADPFVKRLRTGMPWVIAKWAQTLDGRAATRAGQSQWISSQRSRRRVHALRSRVDAVITGMGTVRADDPQLNARDARHLRRTAARCVVDGELELPLGSRLVRTAREIPVIACCKREWATSEWVMERRRPLEAAGVQVMPVRSDNRHIDLDLMLGALWNDFGYATVMVEAGPGLLGAFFDADLVDEAVVYVAPVLLGDEQALAVATGRVVPSLDAGRNFRLVSVKRVGDDIELVYRKSIDHL